MPLRQLLSHAHYGPRRDSGQGVFLTPQRKVHSMRNRIQCTPASWSPRAAPRARRGSGQVERCGHVCDAGTTGPHDADVFDDIEPPTAPMGAAGLRHRARPRMRAAGFETWSHGPRARAQSGRLTGVGGAFVCGTSGRQEDRRSHWTSFVGRRAHAPWRCASVVRNGLNRPFRSDRDSGGVT